VESFRGVYEKMEAKRAAKILDEMDLTLSSQILGGMRGERAAEILSQMSPDKARLITERYLGKRTPASSKPVEVKQEDKEETVESAVSPTKGGVK
jgi:flagellar motility protein MotE (MotC chaperone)